MAAKKMEPVPMTARESSTADAVGLLTSILQQVRQQVTVPPLQDAADAAVREFRRIRAGLLLTQRPTVTLEAVRNPIDSGESATLRWTSTNAVTVVINNNIGEVSPVAGGEVTTPPLTATTTFTASAAGACGTNTSSVEVRVRGVDVDVNRAPVR